MRVQGIHKHLELDEHTIYIDRPVGGISSVVFEAENEDGEMKTARYLFTNDPKDLYKKFKFE